MLIDTDKLHALVIANRLTHEDDIDALSSIERFENALLLVQKVAEKTNLIETKLDAAITREEFKKARLFTSKTLVKKSLF